jgi:GTP-binding protein
MKSFDLMFELGAEEWQLDFPTVYGSAKKTMDVYHWENVTDNVEALDMVVENVLQQKFLRRNTNVNYIFRFLSIYRSYVSVV